MVALGDNPPPLRNAEQIQGLLELLVLDTWHQPNGAARTRAVTGALLVAVRLLEIGEIETRLSALEHASHLGPKLA